MSLVYLQDHWDARLAATFDGVELLRYRSNLLGADLRITNFGGGNTSSKLVHQDPLTGKEVEVMWVKGSGGDLGSIKREGFAALYMDKFLALKEKYRGEAHEDEMLDYYPLCRFGLNNVAASIDTPLHGLIPYKHVDHTHPDWAIALAASAIGQRLLQQFNVQFGFHLIWLPWQRPGYHLGTMLEAALQKNPHAEGLILASHGLITWGNEQYECYRNSLAIIDALGQFVLGYLEQKGERLFGGLKFHSREDRHAVAAEIFPFIRGQVSKGQSFIGHYYDLPEVLRFVNSHDSAKLAFQGTSCPDHFIRTKVRPLYVEWNPQRDDLQSLRAAIQKGLAQYDKDYASYYDANKEADSPAMRGTNPTVVLIPGIGMFSFGKSKKEARITAEFYVNAIHVMEGATAMHDGQIDEGIESSRVVDNYVALAPREAFRIEYWALEEAKLRRQPAEKEMARKVALVIGAGSGIGREFCFRLVKEGAHVVVADREQKLVDEVATKMKAQYDAEAVHALALDITDRKTVRAALKSIALHFGGVDVLINTAAIVIPPDKGESYLDETWDKTLRVNVSGNYIITEEFAEVINVQQTSGAVLLTSSANAVVPKMGSEPYDVSKAAVSHLIRELAIRFAPHIRVNGISPATVVEGSAMFPRERVIANLKKYAIAFDESE
ncbi:bifunctional rhamnulose-1-phosphate aldolase/short-chain dehydrogenase, partial [candidate division KSB1 bacterium]|nr:bifunctional rhamnulose-1-phosphate aldolase/short-chain dehydrogenase [candidate division KSB1 bacterium]